ncbi:hypothetical protein N665_0281s0042 [Sinapis alba]|nr:hypothetical protein N665_0281s0042 [Sinapis alba]
MERIIGGEYKLGRKIGGGSSGEIFLATHVDTFEIVAVKIVSFQLLEILLQRNRGVVTWQGC